MTCPDVLWRLRALSPDIKFGSDDRDPFKLPTDASSAQESGRVSSCTCYMHDFTVEFCLCTTERLKTERVFNPTL